MRFGVICSLRIGNGYYRDGRCPDFRVEPTPGTLTVLRRHRYLVRPMPDGLQFAAALDGKGAPLLPIDGSEVLRIRLSLANSDFLLFTQPQPTPNDGRLVFIPDEKATAADTRILRSTREIAPPAPVKDCYAEAVLPGGVLGGATGEHPLEFRIQFEPKAYRWRLYYCSDRVLTAGPEMSLSSAANEVKFQKVKLASDDPQVARLGQRHPGHQVTCFESLSTVPCQEPPRPRLKLTRGDRLVVASVNSPSVRDYGRFGSTEMLFLSVVDTAKNSLAIQN